MNPKAILLRLTGALLFPVFTIIYILLFYICTPFEYILTGKFKICKNYFNIIADFYDKIDNF